MSMEKNSQQEQTAQENTVYNEAVSRFQQACKDIKAKKSALYEAFQNAEALFKAGESKRMRLENGDPFSIDTADIAVMNTGDPIDDKKYVAYGRSIAMPIFCDDAFSAEVIRVIQAVSEDAKAEEAALVTEVLEAEKELAENRLRLQKKVSEASRALAEHRAKIQRDIVFPAIEADTFLLDSLPEYITGPVSSRNTAIRIGYDIAVSDQIQGLLCQMNVARYHHL